jgi:hypothetical protein
MLLLQQIAFMGVFFLLPGLVGARIAWTKGRNPLLYFLFNCIFPPTLMITLFQNPKRPVEGHYRLCSKCQEYNKWQQTTCKYCQTEFSA